MSKNKGKKSNVISALLWIVILGGLFAIYISPSNEITMAVLIITIGLAVLLTRNTND